MLFILLKINSISDSRKIFLFLSARQLLILYSVWILLKKTSAKLEIMLSESFCYPVFPLISEFFDVSYKTMKC